MITFPFRNREVGVTLAVLDGSSITLALESKIFNDWLLSLDSRFIVRSIQFQAIDFRGGNQYASGATLMFLRFLVETENSSYLQIAELRGKSVTLLPILRCEDNLYVALVKQPRLPTGHLTLAELPAGMVEGGAPKGAAIRELEEEVGLSLTESSLMDLSAVVGASEGIYASPGLINEQVRFYLVEKEIEPKELARLQGKAMGVISEGEKITVQIVPLEEILKATTDAKVFIAMALYHYFKSRISH